MLGASMRHLVLNGIRDFYLYDHDNDPCLLDFLSGEFSPGEIRLQVLRKETQLFFQSVMVNALAELARMDGFDVAVSFDSDEFWCSTIKDRTLADQIRVEMSSDVEALITPVINYVQHDTADTFTAESLLQCRYSVVPFVDSTRHARDQMNAGIPFVALPFPSKVISRLSQESRFTDGNHSVDIPKGEHRLQEAVGIVVRHLPFHSRSHVEHKRRHGLRRIAAGYSPEVGWQEQRLVHMTETELDHEWRNNAWRLTADQQAVAGTYGGLVQDEALVQIGRDLARTCDPCNKSRGTGGDETSRFPEIPSQKLEQLVQHLVDDYGKLERQFVVTARELKAIKHSWWWFLTVPLQVCATGLRKTEKRLRNFRKRHFRKQTRRA